MSSSQRSGLPVRPFVATVDADAALLSALRHDFVAWMEAADLDQETNDELAIVLSELVANAVAASSTRSDDIRVRAELDEGMLSLEVSNHAGPVDQRPSFSIPELDDPLRSGGRGFLIVRALVDSVDVDIEGDRLVVRCCRRLPPR